MAATRGSSTASSRSRKSSSGICAAVLQGCMPMLSAAAYTPSEEVRKSQAEFAADRFGIFIHWGSSALSTAYRLAPTARHGAGTPPPDTPRSPRARHQARTRLCSQYALEALRKHGPAKGLWLAVKRIMRCHPQHTLHGMAQALFRYGYEECHLRVGRTPGIAPGNYAQWIGKGRKLGSAGAKELFDRDDGAKLCFLSQGNKPSER